MAAGAFMLWPLDTVGNFINWAAPQAAPAAQVGSAGQADLEPQVVGPQPPPDPGQPQNPADPSHPDAVDIYFGVLPNLPEPPPMDQVDLLEKIQRALRTIQVLYLTAPVDERKRRQFRSYYVRLFRLGQVGLEVANVSTDVASSALATTIADLIDDEAGNVKGTHLRRLGGIALKASAACAVLYILLRLVDGYYPRVDGFLLTMGIDSLLLANFMLLLIGASLGVWLSYAIRTTTFTLSDLTVTDADRLTPSIRLIYAGALTVILGILFVIPLVEVKLGTVSMTSIATQAMTAFVVGAFCGISELTLPTAVAKRASDFIQNIK